MTPLASQILGVDKSVLLIQLPSHVTDEWGAAIQQEVHTRLPRIDKAAVVLDFECVELINSIGITCLLQIEEECRRRRARLMLARIPATIVRFFQQLKLDKRFVSVPTVDDALARVNANG